MSQVSCARKPNSVGNSTTLVCQTLRPHRVGLQEKCDDSSPTKPVTCWSTVVESVDEVTESASVVPILPELESESGRDNSRSSALPSRLFACHRGKCEPTNGPQLPFHYGQRQTLPGTFTEDSNPHSVVPIVAPQDLHPREVGFLWVTPKSY